MTTAVIAAVVFVLGIIVGATGAFASMPDIWQDTNSYIPGRREPAEPSTD